MLIVGTNRWASVARGTHGASLPTPGVRFILRVPCPTLCSPTGSNGSSSSSVLLHARQAATLQRRTIKVEVVHICSPNCKCVTTVWRQLWNFGARLDEEQSWQGNCRHLWQEQEFSRQPWPYCRRILPWESGVKVKWRRAPGDLLFASLRMTENTWPAALSCLARHLVIRDVGWTWSYRCGTELTALWAGGRRSQRRKESHSEKLRS